MVATRTLLDALNASAKTALSPAVILGMALATTYPGVSVGTLANSSERQANGVALQAFLDYCATNGLTAFLPAGVYQYEAAATQNAQNTGLHAKKELLGLLGAGMSVDGGTVLVQFASNHPILTIGDVTATAGNLTQGGNYGDFALAYGASQSAQTSAYGLLLGRIWQSQFNNIYISGDYAGAFPPYIGLRIGVSSAQFFFNNVLDNIIVRSGQRNILHQIAIGTGCKWGMIYLGGGDVGSRVALTGPAFFAEMSGNVFGTIDQLNIEWVSGPANDPLLRNDSQGLVISQMYFEGNQLNGFDPAMIHNVFGYMVIGTMRSLDTWIASANASGNPRILSSYADCRVEVSQMTLSWSGGSERVASMAFRLYGDDASVVGRSPYVSVGDLKVEGNTGAFSLDANTTGAAPGSAGAIAGLSSYEFNKTRSRTEGVLLEMRNADMTIYAQHRFPQVRLTQAITADRKLILSSSNNASGIGNVATRSAGDVINVWRQSGATGAFNLNVRNAADDATIFALTAANTEGSAMLDTAGAWDVS